MFGCSHCIEGKQGVFLLCFSTYFFFGSRLDGRLSQATKLLFLAVPNEPHRHLPPVTGYGAQLGQPLNSYNKSKTIKGRA